MTEYTIYRESNFSRFRKKISNKAEDLFLSVALCLAKITKSQKISSWIEKYLDTKTQKLQHEIIRKRWDGVALEKIVTSIHESN